MHPQNPSFLHQEWDCLQSSVHFPYCHDLSMNGQTGGVFLTYDSFFLMPDPETVLALRSFAS